MATYQRLVRDVLFPLHEWAKRHPTLRILKEMEAADRCSPAELDHLRRAKLRDLIHYTVAHVPYVRTMFSQRGIAAEQIRDVTDLARLPIMRKADIRQNRELLRSEIAGTLSTIATGGSTGEPLICYLSKRRIASRVACRQRVSRWWGLSVGDSEIALWGSPIELNHQDRLRELRDKLLATKLLPAFQMDAATMSRYLDAIAKVRCRQLFGYPSALYLLCLHAKKHGIVMRDVGVKTVFVTGEVLLAHHRELISDTFNCPVADGYGGRDSGFIAHECPQGSMHIMADAVVVELLDHQGQPVAPGEAGEIVVTDLYSHEAPFLRYATGDLGVLSSGPCRCGRPSQVFEKIEGRANDSIVTADGRVINSLALIYPVREVSGIEQFRIVQRAVDSFSIDIVRNSEFRSKDEEHIRQSWEALLRGRLQIIFNYPVSLPAETSGKFRYVISEVQSARMLGGYS